MKDLRPGIDVLTWSYQSTGLVIGNIRTVPTTQRKLPQRKVIYLDLNGIHEFSGQDDYTVSVNDDDNET